MNWDRRGPANPHWKGGRHVRADGRVLIKVEHGRAGGIRMGGTTYMLEYRLVAEQKLGRPLRRGEVVHHINHDASDNRPENLEVTTQAVHAGELHPQPRSKKNGRFVTRKEPDGISND